MVGYLDNKLESDRVLQEATAPAPAPGGLLAWWRSEERILAQIEVLLVVYVLLIVLQVVVGRWRRCSSSAFIKYPLLLAYTATNPLATYTLGVMFNSSYKSNPLLLMSALLIYGLGGINSMTAYNVDDNKRYLELLTQHVFVVATYLATISNFVPEYNTSKTNLMLYKVLLIGSYVFTISERVVARMMAGSFSDDSSEQLQQHMNMTTEQHTPSDSYDPVTLRGYRYLLVADERRQITVSDIWLSNQGPLGSGGGAQLKEVCLSYALFILLRRRFFGASCPEAKLQKTHDLVFNGLLLHVDENYQAAYRIIETELAFAHDHFFTSSASLFSSSGLIYMSARVVRVTLLYPTILLAVAVDFFQGYYKGAPLSSSDVSQETIIRFMAGAIGALMSGAAAALYLSDIRLG